MINGTICCHNVTSGHEKNLRENQLKEVDSDNPVRACMLILSLTEQFHVIDSAMRLRIA